MTPFLILPLEEAKFNPRVCSKRWGPGKALLTQPTHKGQPTVAGDKLALQVWTKYKAALVQVDSAHSPCMTWVGPSPPQVLQLNSAGWDSSGQICW